ncbi:MAG TPA: cytochrome c3 family protein [Chthonomonadaceae bacterium]|nr:cytochrome c3 family protein [Chthonomonadaceae bacterium]
MRRMRAGRLGFLSLFPALPLLGLVAMCYVLPAPPKTQKLPPFPLSLFAQATPDDYVDEKSCIRCHAKSHNTFVRSPHAPFVNDTRDPIDKHGCQSCHGPGRPHIAHLKNRAELYNYVISYTRATPIQGAMACLRCHADTMTLAHWRRTGHAHADVGCNACHQIHQDLEDTDKSAQHSKASTQFPRARVFVAAAEPRKLLKADEATLCGQCHPREVNEFRQNFHHPVPEGRMVCSDCHEIHPRHETERQEAAQPRFGRSQLDRIHLRGASDMCVTCHPETAGPFVFEHDPVTGLSGDGCLECHRPHGSHNPRLLTLFSRGACNQCHTDKANNHFPGRTCWQTGCHVGVHGSNTDRFLLQR